MESLAPWQSQDSTLAMDSQDDFQQFLDMGIAGLGEGMNFDFPDFTNTLPSDRQAGQQLHQHVQPMQHTRYDADTRKAEGAANTVTMLREGGSARVEALATHDMVMEEAQLSAAMAGAVAARSNVMDASPSLQAQKSTGTNANIAELDAQIQYLQQQRRQQQQRRELEQQQNFYVHHRYIPPTPNSVEMTAAAGIYSSSAPGQAGLMERYRAQRDQEIAFTPLASPAVTPLDTHFAIPEYTVPGAYFSPLSSPALHAQTEHTSTFGSRHAKSTTSPVESTYDSHSVPGSAIIFPRKSGKRMPTKQRSAVRSVRQSPIVKPMKRRSLSTTIPGHALIEVRETIISPQQGHVEGTSTETSEEGSISPEHLSDMAPPPVPPMGSISQSPSILAHKSQVNAKRLSLGSPATPASLMKLTQSPTAIQPHTGQDMDIDTPLAAFQLPAAVQAMPLADGFGAHVGAHSRKDSTISSKATPKQVPATPTSRTPTFGPQASIFAHPVSNPQNNSSVPIAASPSTNITNRSTSNASASRPSKKRSLASNGSSQLISPAILPRISPGIKPLLPSTATSHGLNISEDTASLLLASKSNYQNILEGNHLPGVSYPSELSTNLTSKRTSHKIAEQGRRNRINQALQEMGKLLPKRMGGAASDGDNSQDTEKAGENKAGGEIHAEGPDTTRKEAEKEEEKEKMGSSAAAANSKASTVECAIEYIKQLQSELQDARQRADKAESELQNVQGGGVA